MNIPMIKYGLSGRFRITATTPDGCEKTLAEWFPNLITNNGLNLLGLSSNIVTQCLTGCAVGAGSSAPSVTDTALDSLVAFSSSATTSTTVNIGERYLSIERTYTFSIGLAEGNLSEIGVGSSSSSLFSRALILDSAGNPTTITVLDNEILTVSYELRVNQPTTDYVSSVDGYSTTLRAARVNNLGTDAWDPSGMSVGGNPGVYLTGSSSGGIQPITGYPSAGFVSATSRSIDSYVSDSHVVTGSFFFNTSVSNRSNPAFVFKAGPGLWQFSVSPTVDKLNTDELTIGFSIGWAREGELPS